MKMNPKNEFPKKGEIWIADYSFKFSALCAGEQDFTVESPIKKSRPCIVISNNIQNEFGERVFVIPLTSESTMQTEELLEVLVSADQINKLHRDSKALITLATFLSKEFRLKRFVGFVSKEVTEEIVEKLINLIN